MAASAKRLCATLYIPSLQLLTDCARYSLLTAAGLLGCEVMLSTFRRLFVPSSDIQNTGFLLLLITYTLRLNISNETENFLRHFKLPSRCRWDLCSCGILRSVEWQCLTDVSGLPIRPMFTGKEIQAYIFLDLLALVDGTDCPETSVRNNHSTLRSISEESNLVTSWSPSRAVVIKGHEWRGKWPYR